MIRKIIKKSFSHFTLRLFLHIIENNKKSCNFDISQEGVKMEEKKDTVKKRFITVFLAFALAFSSALLISSAVMAQTAQAASVKLNKTRKTMKTGQTYKLVVKGARGPVKWKSSKKSVATVNAAGIVKAKKKGTANIYAQTGKKKLRCRITVKNPAPRINKKSLTIYRGGVFRLSVKYPTSKVKWSSSNKKVATVSSNGTVIAKKNGKTTITAAMRGKKLRCSVVVKSAPAPGSNNPAPSTPTNNSGTNPGNASGTPAPAQPSTEHTHDWKLAGDGTTVYYCGEPLRYVCTSCGQLFGNYDDLLKHISGFLVSDSNVTDVKIYNGPKPCGNYAPDIEPQIGTMQFWAMGGPIHQSRHRNGQLIYGVPLTSLTGGSYTDTPELSKQSNESYEVFWNGSSAKTMVVCSCGAIFANQECLDRHIKLVNDLNTRFAKSMGTTPYLHHKKGSGVECGICKETHLRGYTCSICNKSIFKADPDYPKSLTKYIEVSYQ